jgi:transposase-like protein
MGKQRQTWTIGQTLTLILAAVRDAHSVAGRARQYGVSEPQIYRWKAQFLEGGRQALGGAKPPGTAQRLQSEHAQLKKRLGEKAWESDIRKRLSRLCAWPRWQPSMSCFSPRFRSAALCV